MLHRIKDVSFILEISKVMGVIRPVNALELSKTSSGIFVSGISADLNVLSVMSMIAQSE
jgi:hypothetical protein